MTASNMHLGPEKRRRNSFKRSTALNKYSIILIGVSLTLLSLCFLKVSMLISGISKVEMAI